MANKIEYALGLNLGEFERGLSGAQDLISGFADKAKMKIAGILPGGLLPGSGGFASAFGAGLFDKLEQLANHVNDYSKELKNLHEETGQSREDLQVFDFIAQKHGKTLSDVVQMMDKFTLARAKALQGGEDSESAQRIDRLGVSFKKLSELSADEGFRMMFDHVSGLSDKTSVAADMVSVLGKTSIANAAVFNDSFESMREKAVQLGVVIKEDVLRELEQSRKLQAQLKTHAESMAAPAVSFGMQLYSSWLTAAAGIKDTILNSIGKISDEELAKRLARQQKNLAESFTILPETKKRGSAEVAGLESEQDGIIKGRLKTLYEEIASARLKMALSTLSIEDQITVLLDQQKKLVFERESIEGKILRSHKDATTDQKTRIAEIQLKELKLKAELLEIEKKRSEIQKKIASGVDQFAGSVNKEWQAKRDALAWQEEELRSATISRRRFPKLYSAQGDLLEYDRLINQAKTQFDKGEFDAARKTQDQALQLKKGIEFLRSNEADPFKELSKSSEESAAHLNELTQMFRDGTATTQTLGAP